MEVEISDNEALQLADSAFDLVETDPGAARELARRALSMARRKRAAEAEVAALHALSFAQHRLGEAQSIRTIRRAVRTGERHGLTRRTALARRRLALDLAARGAIPAAMLELDRAYAVLDSRDRARSEVFRIAVLWCAGTGTISMAETDRALAILRRGGDAFWEAQLLRNRGGLLLERGDTDVAERDLMRARELFLDLGATAAAVVIDLELTRLALIQGDLPRCLARLDVIDPRDARPVKAEVALIRAQATATARLRSESLEALKQAEAVWRQTSRDEQIGRLETIRLMLLAGDASAARELARRFQRSFAAQRRDVSAARAAGLALVAAIASGTVRRSDLRAGRGAAERLSRAGWHTEAQRVRLSVARAALELGSLTVARREMAACSALRRRGSITDRIEFWHVEALMRLAGEDRAGAQRAAGRGLGLLESHRETLGASDLRAAASEIGVELAQLGLGIALDAADTASMLRWAERLRGSAMRLVPPIPSTDPELREHEIDLRRVHAAARGEARSGSASRTLRARQEELEEAIRRRARHATGAGRALIGEPSAGQLAAALGDAALVELVELDGTLTALTLSGGHLGRHRLGPIAAVKVQLDWLRFALTRLSASRRRTRVERDADQAGARASALALDRLLLEPLAGVVGNRSVVLVPTGALHALPWAMLPTMRGRPVVIAPSAATWLGLQTRTPAAGARVVAVAGPRLRHSVAEAEAVGALYGSATILSRREATVPAVTEALDGATVAHLACHGNFRADSPLFSSLELCDGALNVYELQRLARAPELIVLSGCDLAVSDTRPGDELLGFAAALIGMGSRTVIASVAPVPDAATKRLMIAFHELLRAGESPAAALASAQAALGPRHAALAGFVCLGTG